MGGSRVIPSRGGRGRERGTIMGGSGRNTTLTVVVDSQTEAIDRRRRGSVGVVGRSLRQEALSHSKSEVEISGAWGGWAINSRKRALLNTPVVI